MYLYNLYMHYMSDSYIHSREIASRCAAGKILRAARIITRKFDTALRDTGLTISQFGLLNAINLMKPDSITRISDAMEIDRTTLSRNLARLEKSGLIYMGEPDGARKREVLLTSRALELLDQVYPIWQAVQDDIEVRLSPEELAGLNILNDRLAD